MAIYEIGDTELKIIPETKYSNVNVREGEKIFKDDTIVLYMIFYFPLKKIVLTLCKPWRWCSGQLKISPVFINMYWFFVNLNISL